jgi:hypothetical protein
VRHIAITSLVLGFWLAAGAAQAASVTFDFSGEYLEGGQPGTGEDVSLLLSLDESSALNNGDQLSANAVLEFEGYDPVTFDIFNVEAFLGWNLEPPPVIYLLSSAYDNSTLGLGLSSISGAALNSVSALVTAVQAEDLVVFYEIDLTAFNPSPCTTWPPISARASLRLRSPAWLMAARSTPPTIEADARLSIITDRDEAGLEIIRHSTAHLLAMAVQELFPGTQVTIGPTIEDGFYYDFAGEHSFTPEDLPKRSSSAWRRSSRRICRSSASSWIARGGRNFEKLGEHYKVQIIRDLPEGEEISIYQQGEWMDLCRGPHVPSTGKLGAFKLTKLAGCLLAR